MVDFKKGVVITAITILFAVLVFSIAFAIQEGPEYEDFCDRNGYYPEFPEKVYVVNETCEKISASNEDAKACNEKGGYIEYTRDSDGCATEYSCNTCQAEHDLARQGYDLYVFLFSGILAVLAVIGGLYLPRKSDLGETLSTGFMFGGLLTLLVGTMIYFNDASIVIRPVIILVEMGIIILVAYKHFKK